MAKILTNRRQNQEDGYFNIVNGTTYLTRANFSVNTIHDYFTTIAKRIIKKIY